MWWGLYNSVDTAKDFRWGGLYGTWIIPQWYDWRYSMSFYFSENDWLETYQYDFRERYNYNHCVKDVRALQIKVHKAANVVAVIHILLLGFCLACVYCTHKLYCVKIFKMTHYKILRRRIFQWISWRNFLWLSEWHITMSQEMTALQNIVLIQMMNIRLTKMTRNLSDWFWYWRWTWNSWVLEKTLQLCQ